MDQGQFYSALGVVWVFGFVVVLLVAWNMRNKRRIEKLKLIHEERMKAMEKGIPLPEFPELDKDESKIIIGSGTEASHWNPRWPLGAGALLIMGGTGTMIAMMMSRWELHNALWPFGLIGIFLGVGFFLLYALTRTPTKKD